MTNLFQVGDEVFIVNPEASGISECDFTECFFDKTVRHTIKSVESEQCYILEDGGGFYWFEESLALATNFEVEDKDLEALLGDSQNGS